MNKNPYGYIGSLNNIENYQVFIKGNKCEKFSFSERTYDGVQIKDKIEKEKVDVYILHLKKQLKIAKKYLKLKEKL